MASIFQHAPSELAANQKVVRQYLKSMRKVCMKFI